MATQQFGSQASQIMQVEGKHNEEDFSCHFWLFRDAKNLLSSYSEISKKWRRNNRCMSQSVIRISVSLQGTTKLPVIFLVFFTQGTWVHGLAVELPVLG